MAAAVLPIVENTGGRPEKAGVPVTILRLALLAVLSLGQLPAQGGLITTVVGTGERGVGGDGSAATAAQIDSPGGIAFDAAGNLYLADGNRVRRVNAAGIITTVAGNGLPPPLEGPSGDGGPATSASLYASAIAFDGSGSLYIAHPWSNRVRLVTPDGIIRTVAGIGGATAIAFDGAGNLYAADATDSARIVKVTRAGVVSTVAGGWSPYNPQRPPLGFIAFGIAGIAVDATGNIFFSDQNWVRKLTPAGVLTTVAGRSDPRCEYCSDEGGFTLDGGPATAAQLNKPTGIAIGRSGELYIADQLNRRIRKVDAAGVITTVAGGAGAPPPRPAPGAEWGDGGPATAAILALPEAVALDSAGSLYISDYFRIRKVTPGVATTSGSPQISRAGIVNAASFWFGFSPGSIISIFGTNLATTTLSATTVPLPTELGGTSVSMVGVLRAPIFFVSPNQINAQVPFEIQPGSVDVTVRVGSSSSPTERIEVDRTAPGIFQFDTNRAVAQNQDLTLNTASNPATPGSVITAYLTGQGQVDNFVPTGAAARADPLSRPVLPTTATIGGRSADVLFSGLTPGSVGLLQVNIRVPSGVTGNVPLIVRIGLQPSNTALISVRQP